MSVGAESEAAVSMGSGSSHKQSAVSKLDWIALPLIALITLVFIVVGTRLIISVRHLHSISTIQKCIVPSATGLRALPDSVCHLTNPDGQDVEYRFNSCGDRTPLDCDKKPEGIYRIVLIGSSVAMGSDIDESDSLAERLTSDLSNATHRRVQVYNSAMLGSGGSPSNLAGRMSRVIALKPDLILWVLASYDVNIRKMRDHDREFREGPRTRHTLDDFADDSKVAEFLRGLLYRSQSVYLGAYIRNIRDTARLPENSRSEEDGRMRLFGSYVKAIVDQARDAGVPVVAAFLPNRAEADLLSMRPAPVGIDSERRNNEVRSILVGNGATYVDVLPDLEKTPNLDGLYDQLGYHLTAQGHAALTEIIARALTGGLVPALAGGEQAQSEKMQKE
jgi:hypothetical protein